MSRRHEALGGLVLFCAALAVGQADLDAALRAMADTERAFARRSVERGVRAAFYEFFAEEGVGFTPHPVKERESQRRQPVPDGPPSPVTLDWEPVYGDIAQSADLGYLTGPFLLTDQSAEKRPPRWGYYSSVWKKQPDGTWRVMADMGVSTPPQQGPLPRNAFRAAPREPASASAGAGGLREAEQALASDAARGVAAAYAKFLSPLARVHRSGHMPFTTPQAIRDFLATAPQTGRWETMQAETSRSGDFGYTYGRYELTNEGATAETGFYLRVWKRNPAGEWKLIFDVANRQPTQSP